MYCSWICLFILPCRLAADVDQVHERAASRHQGGPEAHVRQHHAGLPRDLEHAAVATHALRCRLPAHRRSGAAQVRPARLEHTVRVQRRRLQRVGAVRAEPPRRHGPQAGESLVTLFVVFHQLTCFIITTYQMH